MNTRSKAIFAALGATLIVCLAPVGAGAAVPLNTVTGVVTAPTTSDRIYVDGRPYHIVSGSAASVTRNSVRVGQTVDVVFAPRGKSAAANTDVIAISVHPAPAAGGNN